jgi:nucleotide-binding universal stress UspA family protein
VTRAMGPHAGWMGGWDIIVADIIVMANLAQIASKYSFLLFGAEGLAESLFWVTLVGCVFIAVMTWICHVGIEASARTQYFLLGAEIVTLVIFAAVALGRVWFGDVEGSVAPSLSWLNPFAIDDLSGLTAGILVTVFIYWGWDLRHRLLRRPGLRRARDADRELRRRAGHPRHRRARVAAGQAADHRRADLGGGLAGEHQARMIVVGTHGERPLMGVVLGSTAYKLLVRSPVPLLVVPAPALPG